jgi:hypothetical protein
MPAKRRVKATKPAARKVSKAARTVRVERTRDNVSHFYGYTFAILLVLVIAVLLFKLLMSFAGVGNDAKTELAIPDQKVELNLPGQK